MIVECRNSSRRSSVKGVGIRRQSKPERQDEGCCSTIFWSENLASPTTFLVGVTVDTFVMSVKRAASVDW